MDVRRWQDSWQVKENLTFVKETKLNYCIMVKCYLGQAKSGTQRFLVAQRSKAERR